jgi:hypothetical protein
VAYDLIAKFSLQDNMSSPMKKITNNFKRMERVTRTTEGSFSRMGRIATRSLSTIGMGASRAASSVGSLRNGFLGLAAAIGGAYAAKKLFDKTIVAAAQHEMRTITIGAMFQGDDKGAQKFIDMISNRAIASPLFGENDYFENSKTFLTMSKNMGQLDKILDITERLAASDPTQGMSGAAFALRELASGDGLSLAERFEIPKKLVNQIKKLPLKEQLIAMDKYLSKIGFGAKFLDDIGGAALAHWNQISEKVGKGLKEIGLLSLEELKPALIDVNRFLDGEGFKTFIHSTAKKVANGFRNIVNAGRELSDYIQRTYINNHMFQKLSIKGKLEFVIEDVWKRFMKWFETTGSKQLADMTSFVMTDIGEYIVKNSDKIAEAGASLGFKLVSAMGTAALNSMPGLVSAIGDEIGGKIGAMQRWVDVNLEGKNRQPKIAYQGRPSGMSKGPTINQTNSFKIDYHSTGNTEKDADTLLQHMARRINEQGGLMSGY